MSGLRINIRDTGRDIAATLHRGIKAKQIVRIDIDGVRAAVVSHLAAVGISLPLHDFEILVDQSLRIFVEKCA